MNVYTDTNLTPEPWMSDGSCGEIGGDFWFPEAGGPSLKAKQVCRACPAAASCLEWALRTKPAHGIYAGRTVKHLAKLRKETA